MVDIMLARGWEFVPTGPEEWTWLLFNSAGVIIARQGDARWRRDLASGDKSRG